ADEEQSICAVVDGDLDAFRSAWNAGMAAAGGVEVLDPDDESGRTAAFAVRHTVLTLENRGGALVVSCSGSSPAETDPVTPESETTEVDTHAPSETAAVSPESSNVTDPEKFRKMVGRALAAAACDVFECPESMWNGLKGQEVICAVCDGTLNEFSRDFGSGSAGPAEPLGEWTRSAPHDREYEVVGIALAVRFNGGAVSVTYTPPEPPPTGGPEE
ncbi:MAG: hypothetical protein R3344_15505, partial [Acidobacteriota bacterium]|nr:hypothetical protein [Acidobacteriota bacterium]